MRHMFDNNLFSAKQFGFIGGRSTVLQVLRVIDEWTEILDECGCGVVIYIDFKRAVHTVWYQRLLAKISTYAMR